MADKSLAVDVGRENFDAVLLRGSAARPVLVEFWAPWCGPCRTLAPILDKMAAEFAGRFTLAKLNTDQEPELATRYGIRGIPTRPISRGRRSQIWEATATDEAGQIVSIGRVRLLCLPRDAELAGQKVST